MIEQTTEGVWVVKGDTHIGKWVRTAKGLAGYNDAALECAKVYCRPGDVVMDVGCNIGAHAFHFGVLVGPTGLVIGIDPNPDCIEASKKNCPTNCQFHQMALGERTGKAVLNILTNTGASFVLPDVVENKGLEFVGSEACAVCAMDSAFSHLGSLRLLKIDAEGAEIEILRGGAQMIAKHRPIIVTEINAGALGRRGHTSQELITLIRSLGYELTAIPHGIRFEEPQFDVLCIPKQISKL